MRGEKRGREREKRERRKSIEQYQKRDEEMMRE